MDTIVGLEELVILLDLDLVILVQEQRHVVITSNPNVQDVYTRPLTAIIQQTTLRTAEDGAFIGSRFSQHQDVSNGVILDSAFTASVPEFANLEREYLDWNDANLDFAECFNQTNGEITQYPSPRSPSLVRQSKGSASQTVQVQQPISPPKLSIPILSTYSIRSLIQQPKIMTGTQRIANLMLHTLKSYPIMMRHSTLPPFIHPGLISSNVENSQMEPLTNCISLVHMISSVVQGNRKLFWKNVRLECERLCEERSSLKKWEFLAAMQALSIYILIRLDEGETDHNSLDFLLIATVAIIAQQFACIDMTSNLEPTINNYGLEISWKDWIFEESRRRLCAVYRVVNMLVYFEPASMCELQTDLLIAPLLANKQLWEARDEFIWKAESERGSEAQTSFGLAANGELVKLEEEQVCCNHGLLLYKSAGDWEEWCSGMDGLGGLVMLAASLVV